MFSVIEFKARGHIDAAGMLTVLAALDPLSNNRRIVVFESTLVLRHAVHRLLLEYNQFWLPC